MKKEPPSPSLHTPIPQRYCCSITRATAGRRESVLRQVVLWTTVSQSQTAPGAAQNLHGFAHRQLLPAKPSEEPSAPHSPVPGAVGALHRGRTLGSHFYAINASIPCQQHTFLGEFSTPVLQQLLTAPNSCYNFLPLTT